MHLSTSFPKVAKIIESNKTWVSILVTREKIESLKSKIFFPIPVCTVITEAIINLEFSLEINCSRANVCIRELFVVLFTSILSSPLLKSYLLVDFVCQTLIK